MDKQMVKPIAVIPSGSWGVAGGGTAGPEVSFADLRLIAVIPPGSTGGGSRGGWSGGRGPPANGGDPFGINACSLLRAPCSLLRAPGSPLRAPGSLLRASGSVGACRREPPDAALPVKVREKKPSGRSLAPKALSGGCYPMHGGCSASPWRRLVRVGAEHPPYHCHALRLPSGRAIQRSLCTYATTGRVGAEHPPYDY